MGALGWIVFATVAAAADEPLQVTGATTCPSPAEVEAAVAGLIGPDAGDQAGDVVTLSDDGGALVVALRRASGEPIGEKRLEAAASCEERARAAAVVIAAWEARLDTQTTTLVVPAPEAPPSPAADVVTVAAPPTPSAPIRLEPGVSAGAALNGTTVAPAATVELALSRPDATLVPAVGALVVGTHSKDVGPGSGTWRRYGLVARLASRRRWSATSLEAHAGVALTLLHITGRSFEPNASGVALDPGIPLGVRAGRRIGPVRWWIDGTVAFWPRGQTLYVNDPTVSTTLPRGEALIAVGGSYEGR